MSFWLLPTSVSCCILEWPISPIWLGAKEKLKLFDTKSLSPLKMQPNTYFRDRLFVTIPTKFVKRILLSAQNGNVCRATRDSSKNSLTIFSTTTVGSRLDASLYPFTAVLWTEGRGVFPTKSDSRNRSQSPWDWRHLTECSCSSLKKKKKKPLIEQSTIILRSFALCLGQLGIMGWFLTEAPESGLTHDTYRHFNTLKRSLHDLINKVPIPRSRKQEEWVKKQWKFTR